MIGSVTHASAALRGPRSAGCGGGVGGFDGGSRLAENAMGGPRPPAHQS